MRSFQIVVVVATVLAIGWSLRPGCTFKTRRNVLPRLAANKGNSKGENDIGEKLAKISDDIIAKADKVSKTVSGTVDGIQSAPRKIADSIDDTVNSVTKTIEDTKKTASDVYNAPGYAWNVAQSAIDKIKKRAALIEEKGAAGLVAPLTDDERKALANLSAEEQAAVKRESLKKNVAAALDITEQVLLLGIEGVKKTPDAIESAKQLVEEAKNIPSKIEAKKMESAKKAEEAKKKAATFQQGISDAGNTLLKWVTLEEPKRLTNEVVETAISTKAGVESLVEDVRADVEGIAAVVSSIPRTVEATKVSVEAFPSRVGAAIDEVKKDVNDATESVTSIPSKLDRKKKDVIETIDKTNKKVSQAAEQVSSLANSAGAVINKAGGSVAKMASEKGKKSGK